MTPDYQSYFSVTSFLSSIVANSWRKTDIEWPDVAPDHFDLPYIRFSITYAPGELACLGGSKTRISGILNFSIFTRVNTGVGESLELVDDLLSLFQNKAFGRISTQEATVVRVGKDPDDINLSVTNVQIPFNVL